MKKVKRKELRIVQDDPSVKEDKRIFCRFELNDIPVRFKDLKIGEKGNGVCRDLSAGGAGFDCVQELKPKTPLELWFDLPDGYEPMHLLGKVTWLRPLGSTWRIGVIFDRPRFMSMSRLLKIETSQSE